MFPDAFGANLAVFLVAQVVAWFYLRTGLTLRGVLLLLVAWGAADLALVLRFAYANTGTEYVASLAVLQGYTVFETLRAVWGTVRRRSGAASARRAEALRSAMVAFLEDDLDAAAAGFRGLVRADPWDLQGRLGLGSVLGRQGHARAARRQLAAARRLDRDGRFEDAITVEVERLRRRVEVQR
ncbi:MAG: hypothetical protein O2865_00370 [Planctomycetota bacterium]|nr:hypothetical protein [Planctomycetota bacterium]MDA1220834.1 hypothetical protein [Planctomycetota bacterium]